MIVFNNSSSCYSRVRKVLDFPRQRGPRTVTPRQQLVRLSTPACVRSDTPLPPCRTSAMGPPTWNIRVSKQKQGREESSRIAVWNTRLSNASYSSSVHLRPNNFQVCSATTAANLLAIFCSRADFAFACALVVEEEIEFVSREASTTVGVTNRATAKWNCHLGAQQVSRRLTLHRRRRRHTPRPHVTKL